MTPEAAMRMALELARRASGRTWPNPPVGALVFRGDRVLGRGFTRPPGGAHAEVVAIQAARRRHGAAALRGASLAVTLEPCSRVGRTGPCSEAIRAAGIARVFAGHLDPSPGERGRGARRLRAAGVAVRVGVLADACRYQHRGFVSVQTRGRPWLALKLAASLDGRIATASGESRWISGPRARARVHALRADADAVAVGAGTALADDPELTARRGRRVLRRPARVLFDGSLRVSPRARLYAPDAPRFALCRESAPAARQRALARRGVRVLALAARAGQLDLAAGLRRLAREGLTLLLVEGGGELAAALLAAGLVDELHWFVSPRLVGGDGVPALGPLGLARLSAAPRLASPSLARLGDDLHFRGTLLRPKGTR
jgi:diaminohydroxyphosphoribosylaminopyrimidine deaminase/5-amino-6-(5-phosphoribosylamino)uracil reductase